MRTILTTTMIVLLAAASFAQSRGAGKVVTRLPSGDQLDLYDNSWAVIIGVNDYDKWPDLQYAVNDARVIRDRMMTLGFPNENISYIIDEEASKTNIERLLDESPQCITGFSPRDDTFIKLQLLSDLVLVANEGVWPKDEERTIEAVWQAKRQY
jgi:hypothetical protein